jgi:hypothetical protein
LLHLTCSSREEKLFGYLLRYINMECVFHFVHSMTTASTSSQLYDTKASQNDTVEIGPGNLKLIYSGKGELTQYINSRSLVCNIRWNFKVFQAHYNVSLPYGVSCQSAFLGKVANLDDLTLKRQCFLLLLKWNFFIDF